MSYTLILHHARMDCPSHSVYGFKTRDEAEAAGKEAVEQSYRAGPIGRQWSGYTVITGPTTDVAA